jgi:hypothetical protein
VAEPPLPLLGGKQIELVSSYKYLGVLLNNKLNWDEQWTRVQSVVSSAPYLIKRLKHLGFKKEILVNVYRSHVLSHFTYSAVLLTSVTHSAKEQMSSFQRRLFRIIGINATTAKEKYGLVPIGQHVDQVCTNLLAKIIAQPSHPITLKLARCSDKSTRTNARFGFKIPKSQTAHHSRSFMPKFLHVLRDGASNLYIPRAAGRYSAEAITAQIDICAKQIAAPPPLAIKSEKPKVVCPQCKKLFKQITHTHKKKCDKETAASSSPV